MKVTVSVVGSEWSEVVELGCEEGSHRHYALRNGRSTILMCDALGVVAQFPQAPTVGQLQVEVVQRDWTWCSECGGMLVPTARGTVHARGGTVGCF